MHWHRDLVRRKWTYQSKHEGEQPPISKELDDMILRLAQGNPRWGYGKIEGELINLDFKVSQTTIRNILDRYNIQPAPVRNSSIGKHNLVAHYKEQILACDFFTVETIRLQTLYVLFFIELNSRGIHLAGVTANPNEIWFTQQARRLIWELDDRDTPLRFLIHDNDGKFSKAFDTLFETEGLRVMHTLYLAPNANYYAEG